VKPAYIFDIDGTLTRPRQSIEDMDAFVLKRFMANRNVYLATGSTYEMVLEQIPKTLLEAVSGVYSCLGNVLHKNGELVYSNEHDWSSVLLAECSDYVDNSEFPYRTGNHIEKRVGALNISTVGRNATPEQRQEYSDWDDDNPERVNFAEFINKSYPEYEAYVGGAISVDICVRGQDKSQILAQVKSNHPHASVIFFGDKMYPGGNDYPLGQAIIQDSSENVVHYVKGYKESFELMKDIISL